MLLFLNFPQEQAENPLQQQNRVGNILKFNFMKKSTWIIGLSAAILVLLGVAFKVHHWPGASIIILIGSASLSVYGLLLYMEKKLLADTLVKKIVNICTTVALFIIPLSFLFKVQPWPGASIGLHVSHVLILLMIPLLIIHAVKEKEARKKLNFQNEAILFIALVAFSVFVWQTRISKQVLDSFILQDISVKKEIIYQKTKADDLFNTLESAVKSSGRAQSYLTKATDIRLKTDSLICYINELGNKMLSYWQEENPSMDSLMKFSEKENTYVSPLIMIIEGKGEILKSKLNAYTEAMDAVTNSRGKHMIELFFNTQDPQRKDTLETPRTWVTENFQHLPLIAVLINMNDMISHIRMLEAETMLYIQAIAAIEINSVPAEKKDKNNK
ncbi:MAG: hypothetical protein A2275_04475 [Bacteroidetes bacterium RIFOXYA12_FULL_35_11]|nr:MAG: hypothetical protein A2X01_07745 [Bacteroidetes bacterium GWF2_35_48]OFY75566.1 MAG: hypothetical protein A2275_04475 [Bacteroidetes bacterium RIFOXYA12_FULL_35_11]OFY99155.1 MAG: hypothetical protein A2491_12950 [Bacteroidetes bacterium RIFOXYC12_FULL_35_7]HBX49798.1 hypothetical protein [Bacteroidales bacterium]